MDIREFHPFGPSHLFAIAATVSIGVMMVTLQRSQTAPESWKRKSAWTLAMLLVLAVLADPVLAWFRYSAGDPVFAARLVHENSWPFYFCDVASFMCAIALVWKNQRVAELAYLWGVAGTVQGLITPALLFDWRSAEYYAFFIQHGGAPVAGLTLAFGMRLAPQPGAVRRAISWGILYLLAAGFANWLIARFCTGTCPNYGFVREKPSIGSLFDYFGPWPWYLLTMVAIAIVFFNLLCLPWRFKPKNLRSTKAPDSFPTMSNEVMIETVDLHRSYRIGKKSIEVLHGIDLSIRRGERVFLCGPSGAGKTTLLYTLAGLERPERGTVHIHGADLYAMGRKEQARFRNLEIGYVFQNYHLLPELTALENVAIPGAISGKDSTEAALKALARVGLSDRADHLPAELSGGEQQRVAIARAIVNEPKVLFADEPTGNLDSTNSAEIMKILLDLATEHGVTLVVVTHDQNLAKVGDRTLVIRDGSIHPKG